MLDVVVSLHSLAYISLQQIIKTMSTHTNEKRLKPHQDQSLKCPRCDSTNTKFCYYNNYSLSQPRYFCKDCRRYWTQGGSLRNVPLGGGCRRNKTRTMSSSTTSSYRRATQLQTLNSHLLPLITPPPPPPPPLPYEYKSSYYDTILLGNSGVSDQSYTKHFLDVNSSEYHNWCFGASRNVPISEVRGKGFSLGPFGYGMQDVGKVVVENVEYGRKGWGGIMSSCHGLVNGTVE